MSIRSRLDRLVAGVNALPCPRCGRPRKEAPLGRPRSAADLGDAELDAEIARLDSEIARVEAEIAREAAEMG
jgi:hypothetical protein